MNHSKTQELPVWISLMSTWLTESVQAVTESTFDSLAELKAYFSQNEANSFW